MLQCGKYVYVHMGLKGNLLPEYKICDIHVPMGLKCNFLPECNNIICLYRVISNVCIYERIQMYNLCTWMPCLESRLIWIPIRDIKELHNRTDIVWLLELVSRSILCIEYCNALSISNNTILDTYTTELYHWYSLII